jgi:hypothetical protein
MAIGSTSSMVRAQPGWVEWCIPSAADLIFIALLILMACTALSTRLLGDAGIGWHIRTGQLILSTHTIPHTDPFSSSMNGHPWFAWEWLYDLIVGSIEIVAGLNGVVLFTGIIISAVFAWTFRLLLRRGTNLFLALILMLLAASAAMIHFQARPHVLSWLFTVAWFYILDGSEPRNVGPALSSPAAERSLWLLPVLMLLWVNVHGGFLIGFTLLAVYWLSAVVYCLQPHTDRFEDVLRTIKTAHRVRTLTTTGVLCALATLVNPYGIKLHVHIYQYLSNRFFMDHIDEFQSPNFHYVAQKCFAVLLLLTIVAVAWRRRGFGLTQILVLLFAISSGLYASRNIPVASLLIVLIIGPYLSRVVGSTNRLQRMETIELSSRGHLWPIAAIVVTGWIAAHGGNLAQAHVMDSHFDPNRFPVAALNQLETRDLKGPVLAPDYWGGYLIYRLYPKAKVVLDDRHDFYGEEFLKSYLKMVHVEPGWQEFLQRNPAQYILIPKESALNNILLETPAYRQVYSDKVTAVFEPAMPQNSSH